MGSDTPGTERVPSRRASEDTPDSDVALDDEELAYRLFCAYQGKLAAPKAERDPSHRLMFMSADVHGLPSYRERWLEVVAEFRRTSAVRGDEGRDAVEGDKRIGYLEVCTRGLTREALGLLRDKFGPESRLKASVRRGDDGRWDVWLIADGDGSFVPDMSSDLGMDRAEAEECANELRAALRLHRTPDSSVPEERAATVCDLCNGTGLMAFQPSKVPKGFMVFAGGATRGEDGVHRMVCPCRSEERAPDVRIFGADGRDATCGCTLTALSDGRHMVHICEECLS